MCQTFLTHRRFALHQNPLPGGDEMSMVKLDSVQLFAMLKKCRIPFPPIETTKKSVKMKYEQLGAGWQDKKIQRVGRGCKRLQQGSQ